MIHLCVRHRWPGDRLAANAALVVFVLFVAHTTSIAHQSRLSSKISALGASLPPLNFLDSEADTQLLVTWHLAYPPSELVWRYVEATISVYVMASSTSPSCISVIT